MTELVLLALAGFVGGAMNALAGGGSFVTLPALIAAGVPSVAANTSSSVALYPAGAVSAWVYRGGLTRVCGVPLRPTLAVTLVGGLMGALLLLWTPSTIFDRVLPWLLLSATATLFFGPRLRTLVQRRFQASATLILSLQFMLGVYGGYFGGAVGLMMMSAWSLLDEADVKSLNPVKTLLVTAANTVAIICFAVAGAVDWGAAAALGTGAIIGGYGGAHLGRRLPAAVIRWATLIATAAITVAFFGRAYFTG
ncbi:sulfite exporter TauE/SafE family protein [Phenylobacterium sp. VNQ135]|uniref:sulfite exporter TauE/SafE family protein n=1 Tax=Phenylobacterium sp. VNQ135 TaxID=3400922 RepID=UPI003BFB96C6